MDLQHYLHWLHLETTHRCLIRGSADSCRHCHFTPTAARCSKTRPPKVGDLCRVYGFVTSCRVHAFVTSCRVHAFVTSCRVHAFVTSCRVYAFVTSCRIYAFVASCRVYAFVTS
jgi:hypothetical protein